MDALKRLILHQPVVYPHRREAGGGDEGGTLILHDAFDDAEDTVLSLYTIAPLRPADVVWTPATDWTIRGNAAYCADTRRSPAVLSKPSYEDVVTGNFRVVAEFSGQSTSELSKYDLGITVRGMGGLVNTTTIPLRGRCASSARLEPPACRFSRRWQARRS